MIKEIKTIREATEYWTREFNAIPQEMLARLMETDPGEWQEVIKPSVGDRVYVYEIPDELETLEHGGTIQSYDKENELYRVELYDGKTVSAAEDDFEVERDDLLPMWGTMWSFGNSCDHYWLEEENGIRKMSECGFRIYYHEEFGYFFGIDGAGYDFYEQHWEPLYKARGLQWHDVVTNERA